MPLVNVHIAAGRTVEQKRALMEIFLAQDEDVAIALRMDGYLKEGSRTGIPVGLYRAGGTESAIYLDADFLVRHLASRPKGPTA